MRCEQVLASLNGLVEDRVYGGYVSKGKGGVGDFMVQALAVAGELSAEMSTVMNSLD